MELARAKSEALINKFEQRVSHINRSNENMFRSHVITAFKATIPYKCS